MATEPQGRTIQQGRKRYGKTWKIQTPDCWKYSLIRNKFWSRCIQRIGHIYELNNCLF